jgi:hypothetical protein
MIHNYRAKLTAGQNQRDPLPDFGRLTRFGYSYLV